MGLGAFLKRTFNRGAPSGALPAARQGIPQPRFDGGPLDFIVIDVETANADLASICQIGAVGYRESAKVLTWTTLLDPQDEFDAMNVSVHGITEADVEGAPTFADAAGVLQHLLHGRIVASHTPFDKSAISRAFERERLAPLECTWLDTARVCRRAWPELARKGYGLSKVAKKLGIEFEHHDALEDARAAGEVLLAAIEHTGLGVQEWLQRVRRPINQTKSKNITAAPLTDSGPLTGEVAVFTGSLTIPRREAAELAARAGCAVVPNVTKKTTLLIVGDQDIRRLNGHEKSNKHRAAEARMAEGQAIRILTESDFQFLVNAELDISAED